MKNMKGSYKIMIVFLFSEERMDVLIIGAMYQEKDQM